MKQGWKSNQVLSSLSNPCCTVSVSVPTSMKAEREIKLEVSWHSLEVNITLRDYMTVNTVMVRSTNS